MYNDIMESWWNDGTVWQYGVYVIMTNGSLSAKFSLRSTDVRQSVYLKNQIKMIQ